MSINKVSSAQPAYIKQEKLANGDTRYTYLSSKCYYDLSSDGSIKFYDSNGKLSVEKKSNGDSYSYDAEGVMHTKLTPEGYLTLYNSDGSIKKVIPPVNNRFSVLG
jgi:antitoxin component YwqK of YwqJK toxin-antitoxin module